MAIEALLVLVWGRPCSISYLQSVYRFMLCCQFHFFLLVWVQIHQEIVLKHFKNYLSIFYDQLNFVHKTKIWGKKTEYFTVVLLRTFKKSVKIEKTVFLKIYSKESNSGRVTKHFLGIQIPQEYFQKNFHGN